jgi:oligopeptide transport system ATP-binding protein
MNRINGLLEVRHLVKHFPITKSILFSKVISTVKAVDDVSFAIREGETLGLVGESGCGKSTLGQCILRLIEPTSGEIFFKGENIVDLTKKRMRPLRREMQIVFQDPYASLNPRKRIRDIIGEPLEVHSMYSPGERSRKVSEMLEVVGLDHHYASRYPHEFSGGQRQRIAIARALCLNPKIIVCDEVVSALDVSIQAQIINLLKGLQRSFDISYLFITHDLGVVRHISDRIAVMYLGKLVEVSDKKTFYDSPQHPYTKALINVVPIPDPKARKKKELLQGDVPSPINPPQGCRFHSRCPDVEDRCIEKSPDLLDIGREREHYVACHVVQKKLARANRTGE